ARGTGSRENLDIGGCEQTAQRLDQDRSPLEGARPDRYAYDHQWPATDWLPPVDPRQFSGDEQGARGARRTVLTTDGRGERQHPQACPEALASRRGIADRSEP